MKRRTAAIVMALIACMALSGCRSLKQLGNITNDNVGKANDSTGSTQEQVKDKSYIDPDKVVEQQH